MTGLMWIALHALPIAAQGTKAANTPLPKANPESMGMSTERLANLGEFFRREAQGNSAAGYSILVARHGKLVYSTAVGMQDREKAIPMSLDTRFRIFSMSKPVTSVAVLMLYEEGKLQLDDPVSRYLPEFADTPVFKGVDAAGNIETEPQRRPITVRHLLTHTSGLGYGINYDRSSPLAKSWGTFNPYGGQSMAESMRQLAKLPLYFQPGSDWRYSYATDVLHRYDHGKGIRYLNTVIGCSDHSTFEFSGTVVRRFGFESRTLLHYAVMDDIPNLACALVLNMKGLIEIRDRNFQTPLQLGKKLTRAYLCDLHF